jgi:hypothetical protein
VDHIIMAGVEEVAGQRPQRMESEHPATAPDGLLLLLD